MKKKIRRYTDWRNWLRGIIGGAIGGGANVITMIIVDPFKYYTRDGLTELWHVSFVSAVVGAALYLAKNTVPVQIEEEEEEESPPSSKAFRR